MSEFSEVKTADMSGEALNWAVAEATGMKPFLAEPQYGNSHLVMARYTPEGCTFEVTTRFTPSTEWRQCGPLIEEFRVSIIYSDETCDPCAWTYSTFQWDGNTSLVAACRAIAASVLGETVSVPKELL